MAESPARDVAAEQLAAIDELTRLVERYQTYLIAESAFAEWSRVLASSASGSARPALVRLHPTGAEGAAKIEAALRVPASDEDRKVVIEQIESSLKDLRAILSTARWANSSTVTTHEQPSATPPTAQAATLSVAHGASPPATARAPREHNARVWIWVGTGMAVGLLLGIFGTRLPQSTGALARVWEMFQPVLAAAAAGVIGGLVLQDGLRETLRKRWLAMLISSILLIATAPSAVDSVRELTGLGTDAQPAAVKGNGQDPANRANVTNPATPASTPNPVTIPAGIQSSPVRPPQTQGPAMPAARPPAQSARRLTAECLELLELESLGQPLSDEQRLLKKECGQ